MRNWATSTGQNGSASAATGSSQNGWPSGTLFRVKQVHTYSYTEVHRLTHLGCLSGRMHSELNAFVPTLQSPTLKIRCSQLGLGNTHTHTHIRLNPVGMPRSSKGLACGKPVRLFPHPPTFHGASQNSGFCPPTTGWPPFGSLHPNRGSRSMRLSGRFQECHALELRQFRGVLWEISLSQKEGR